MLSFETSSFHSKGALKYCVAKWLVVKVTLRMHAHNLRRRMVMLAIDRREPPQPFSTQVVVAAGTMVYVSKYSRGDGVDLGPIGDGVREFPDGGDRKVVK